MLAQADHAIMTFATIMHRLPCPDTNRDGEEDCTNTVQKGWLPSITLRLAGADSGIGVGQLQYLVQRGAGNYDLTLATDTWRPLEYSDTDKAFLMSDTPSSGKVLHLMDWCKRLEEGENTTYVTGMAAVKSAALRPVAYALIHSGLNDADGDGSLFDGINAQPGNQVEDPTYRPVLSSYNDMVLEKSFSSLRLAFNCKTLAHSIDTVALGLDVIQQVEDVRQDNIDSAKRAVIFAALGAAITAIETASTATEGGSDAGNAGAEFGVCGASLGLAVNACTAAPQHTSSSILSAGVLTANGLSIAANVVAAVKAGNALALADSNTSAESLKCTPDNLDDNLKSETILAKAEKDIESMDQKILDTTQSIITKGQEKTIAESTKSSLETQIYNSAKSGYNNTSIDNLISNLLSKAANWYPAYANFNGFNEQVIGYNKLISKLNEQLKLTTDPAGIKEIQNQISENQIKLNSANINKDAASTVLSNALSEYITAYNSLMGTSRYSIYGSNGSIASTGCISSCQPGDINTASAILNGIQQLLGGTPSTAPDSNSAYYAPQRLQKEIDGLNQQLTELGKLKADSIARRDKLQESLNRPATECKITGSGVTPLPVDTAKSILNTVDSKGGIQ